MNQIVLGTIYEGRLCAIHRLDEETGQGWPVKYWPDGPDGYHKSGWYYFDREGMIEGTFTVHPFTDEFAGAMFDYPLITAYDPEYRSVILLVVIADYVVSEPELTVNVKAPTYEQLKNWLAEF